MAKDVWEIKQDTLTALSEAITALGDEISDLQTDWESKSERWQESDKGREVNQWIATLDDYYEELNSAFGSIDDARECDD